MKRKTMMSPDFFTELLGPITAKREADGWIVERDGVYLTSSRMLNKEYGQYQRARSGVSLPRVFAQLNTIAASCEEHGVSELLVATGELTWSRK